MSREDEAVGRDFQKWRDVAAAWAYLLRTSGFPIDENAREEVARLLLEAEPPGTAAQQVAAGYRAGIVHAKSAPADAEAPEGESG